MQPLPVRRYGLLIGGLVLLVYLNTLGNGFNMDDNLVLVDHPLVTQGVAGIPEIFTSNYIVTEEFQAEYRPLVLTTYAIEYELWGYNAGLSHLINVLLYGLCCWQLFLLLVGVGEASGRWRRSVACLVVLVFALHPLHTEVVASLKNRDELLSFLFGVLAARQFWAAGSGQAANSLPLLWGLLFTLLSLMGKLTGLIWFVFTPLLIFFFHPLQPARNAWRPAGRVLLLQVGLALTFYSIVIFGIGLGTARAYYPFETPLAEVSGPLERAPTGFLGLLWYLRLLVFPWPLSYYYGAELIPAVGWGNLWVWASVLLHAGLLYVGGKGLKDRRWWSFAALSYLGSVLMFTNIPLAFPGVIAERAAFYAVLPFALALVLGLRELFPLAKPAVRQQLWRWFGVRPAAGLGLVLLLSTYSLLSIARNAVWQDKFTLYTTDVRTYPESVFMQWQLGRFLRNASPEELPPQLSPDSLAAMQLRHFKAAGELLPGFADAHLGVAQVYAGDLNQPDSALVYYQRVLALQPLHFDANYSAAYLYARQGKRAKAIEHYKKAIRRSPKNPNPYGALASLHLQNDDTIAAQLTLRQLSEAVPESELPLLTMGNYYFANGQRQKGLQLLEQAALKNPNNRPLLQDLADYYAQQNKIAQANFWRRKLGLPPLRKPGNRVDAR